MNCGNGDDWPCFFDFHKVNGRRVIDVDVKRERRQGTKMKTHDRLIAVQRGKKVERRRKKNEPKRESGVGGSSPFLDDVSSVSEMMKR